jgi:autotransporter passenger strand-loop-strand repeat protein
MTNQIIPYGDGSGGMVASVADETLSSQDLLEVRAGGTALHTTVNSGGALETESGGVVSGTTINDGGNNDITGGGTA